MTSRGSLVGLWCTLLYIDLHEYTCISCRPMMYTYVLSCSPYILYWPTCDRPNVTLTREDTGHVNSRIWA